MAKVFQGYGSERGKVAERDRLEERMADARNDGLNLRKLMAQGEDQYEDERLAAQEDNKEEDAPVTAPPSKEDTFVESGWPAAKFEEVVGRIEEKKLAGNEAFGRAVGDDARDIAMDAAIFYLDALDILDETSTLDMSVAQRKTFDGLRLTILLNRAAALNKQDEWKLSLRASNAALKLDSANLKALYRRAIALSGLHKYADAEGDLNRLLALDPTNLAAKRHLTKISQTKLRYQHHKSSNQSNRHYADPDEDPALSHWGGGV